MSEQNLITLANLYHPYFFNLKRNHKVTSVTPLIRALQKHTTQRVGTDKHSNCHIKQHPSNGNAAYLVWICHNGVYASLPPRTGSPATVALHNGHTFACHLAKGGFYQDMECDFQLVFRRFIHGTVKMC